MLADRWKYERKLLNSSFSLSILQSYVPIFTKCIAKSIEHLKANCDKEEFDIKHDVTVVVMNAVMSKNICIHILVEIELSAQTWIPCCEFCQ